MTALAWDEIVEHCSRLHTTRQRPEGPWPDAEMREDSQMLAVVIDGRRATVVPTRIHEPGFYVRFEDAPPPAFLDLVQFQMAVREGLVVHG